MAGGFMSPDVARGNRMVSFLRLVAALTVVALLLSASSCGGDGDDEAGTATDPSPEEGSDDADTATDPPQGEGSDDADADTATSTATDCPSPYTVELEPWTDRADEVQYLDNVTVCTTRAQDVTFIKNDSDAAWTIETARGGEAVDQLTNALRVQVFREAVSQVHPTAVLAPYSAVEVSANPSTVKWTISPGLSAMWLALDELADAGVDYFQDLAVGVLSRGSPYRRALVTCSVGVYTQAGPLAENLDSNNPEQVFGGLIEAASGLTPCGQAVQEADDAARTVQVADDAARTRPRVTTLTDDITRSVVDNASFLRRANRTLSVLKRLGQQVLTAVVR